MPLRLLVLDIVLWISPQLQEQKIWIKKRKGEYVHTGDSVGVVMDTSKGVLSFVVNEVNIGVAYEGIPRDKPLMSCVILKSGGDSVELII